MSEVSEDIFISYSRKDRPIAQSLAELLEEQGWSVWWDIDLVGGTGFRRVLAQKLKTVKCVIVLWSKTSVESRFVCDEANRALNRGVLVPVFIEGNTEQPLGFGELHAIDLNGWQRGQEHSEIKFLFRAIEQMAGTPPQRPQPEAAEAETVLQKEVSQLIKYAKNRFQEIKGEEIENKFPDVIKDIEFESTFRITGTAINSVYLTPDGKHSFDSFLDKLDERTATGMFEKAASEIRVILNSDWVIEVTSVANEKYLDAINSRDGLEISLRLLKLDEVDNGYAFQMTLSEL